MTPQWIRRFALEFIAVGIFLLEQAEAAVEDLP